ncbi:MULTISPECIES: hypothetical protein [unclassified Tolypothrix]|uniref:hypothetical protein n=1 Tax=unclassified Tolypothrix TaxID=2649714 RepID=UPI0012D83AB4|nr:MULTISPECIES: hypothetical protein [unclassified Tolypothrix]MBE9081020.1 hypothetical protein [Tolypothrix sp. LEGE 11397]UYD24914.1 hypothetical protein HGR01_26375 [Tolypothrix sp. PCC 7712]UYD32853.1 hypothetical protein HG267_28260 [Tolypothrix sp. PCC 7601]
MSEIYPSFDGEPITNGSGLTEYQSWVIQALISYRRKRGLTMDALKAYIKPAANQAWVTKESYLKYQESFANGHEAIRNH